MVFYEVKIRGQGREQQSAHITIPKNVLTAYGYVVGDIIYVDWDGVLTQSREQHGLLHKVKHMFDRSKGQEAQPETQEPTNEIKEEALWQEMNK